MTTDGGPPRMPCFNKRNLSKSSTSPKVDVNKKSKIFVTPNRVAILDSDDLSDSEFNTSTSSSTPNEKPAPVNQDNELPILNKQNVTPSTPPIYISNITNFSVFTKEIIRLTRPNAFTCKSITSFLIVHAKGAQNYNTITNNLRDIGACFHTYQPSVYRLFRVLIRNLHHSTL
jgi:hypothetical protein